MFAIQDKRRVAYSNKSDTTFASFKKAYIPGSKLIQEIMLVQVDIIIYSS